MTTNTPIRVLIADDHRIIRDGLKALIASEVDIKVVGEAANGEEIIALANSTETDVVLMDITMPKVDGFEATYAIKSMEVGPRVLILSVSGDEQTVERALEVDMDGFLIKDAAASDLLTAIRELARGAAYFSPSISKILKDLRMGVGRKDGPKLSRRERQVIERVAKSMTNKDVAADLKLSVKTVEKYRQSLMKKLDIHDAVGLAMYAMKRGWVK